MVDANFWLFVIEAIPLAILIGVASATIGYTAWSIVVPLLFVGFGFNVFDALFVSLCTDFIDTSVLTYRYAKKQKVNLKLGAIYGRPGVAAAIIGSIFAYTLLPANQNLLRGGVAYVFLLMGFIFFLRARGMQKKDKANAASPKSNTANEVINSSVTASQITAVDAGTNQMNPNPQKKGFQIPENLTKTIMILGVAISGLLSGLMGIGGGSNFTMLFMFVLGAKYGFDTLRSTGTGCFVMLMVSATLSIVFGALSDILTSIPYLAIIAVFAVIGTIIGLRIAFKVKEFTLNYIISAAIVTAAIVSTVQSMLLA